MIQKTWVLCGAIVTFGILAAGGCTSGGVGDPCTPEDEYQPYFQGYAETEVNTESKSFQCLTRLCLVNHFGGRVSCPYGQSKEAVDGAPTDTDPQKSGLEASYCHVPGTTGDGNRIKVKVEPQNRDRLAKDAVYCSCRCKGPDKDAKYCDCPSGYSCEELIKPNERLGAVQLSGSYCVKAGTVYKSGATPRLCVATNASADPPGDCGTWDGQ